MSVCASAGSTARRSTSARTLSKSVSLPGTVSACEGIIASLYYFHFLLPPRRPCRLLVGLILSLVLLSLESLSFLLLGISLLCRRQSLFCKCVLAALG